MLIHKLKIDYKLIYMELYKNRYTCVLKKNKTKFSEAMVSKFC